SSPSPPPHAESAAPSASTTGRSLARTSACIAREPERAPAESRAANGGIAATARNGLVPAGLESAAVPTSAGEGPAHDLPRSVLPSCTMPAMIPLAVLAYATPLFGFSLAPPDLAALELPVLAQ